MIHHLDLRYKNSNLVIKLDMSKAYDRVSWDFLPNVMQKMGFPTRFLTLIKHAIKNCWFTVLVNGETAGFFKSTQGLRQGDPISPALFILAAEAFSKGLDQLFSKHPDMYYQTQCAIKPSLLSYADDVIIFTNCKEDGLARLIQFLRRYENMSGQRINYVKSAFISGKKASRIAQRIKAITGFTMKTLPITYLGAPLYKGNKRKLLYVDLIDKIRAKIAGWEQCYLSYGGRLQLIKTVLASMPIYLLQVLNPPVSTLQKIEQIFAKFFWGSSTEQKKIHWTKWHNVCYPTEEGGLGIRNLRDMVTAFSIDTKPHIRDVIPLLILWNIWNLRNDSKYEGVAFKASTIIRKTMTYLHNLQKSGIINTEHVKGDLFSINSLHINIQQKVQRQKAIIVHWRKPPEGWYKLNTDGASKGNPGISGADGILRDQSGKVIFAFQEPLGNATNNQTELSAIYRGLQICFSRGLHKIWIETDATAVIKLISAPQRGAWNLQTTLQNISKILSQKEHKLSHIFREGNQVADFLANQACYIQQLCIFNEGTIPGKVKDLGQNSCWKSAALDCFLGTELGGVIVAVLGRGVVMVKLQKCVGSHRF
ncbi:UNVERIFIED_CONTAM: putative ribonuclease H protein [Sesamum radiatum]|uniref:Ribonuclease H protein n=1 Tax=Sesamum radiatum TaxID=300843 RepID=A0AAW2JAA2_SESRA